MKRSLTFAAALTFATASVMSQPALAQTGISMSINAAPPAARYESIPAPRSGHVWAPGYWNWDGSRHAWVAGRWEIARDGYQYQRTEWVRDNERWRLNRGGWQQISQHERAVINLAPPAPRYERIPRARPGYVWVPGYWNVRSDRHIWERGTWLRERQGYVYAGPRWVERNGRWSLEQGSWEQTRDRDRDGVPDRLERRDLDRDGVPDAADRDRDNDGVRNRRDGDRDGDGVRNENDRYPDDRRRD